MYCNLIGRKMRKIYFLRAVLELMLYLSIIGAIGLLVTTPFILKDDDWNIPFTINGVSTTPNTFSSKLMFIVMVLGHLLFVYAIYLFKKTVNLFINKKIFDDTAIKNLSVIGRIFIIVTLITKTIEFTANLITERKTEIVLSSGFDSFLFTIAIGLFFIIMSEVFKMVKNLKEENKLTI